MSATQHYLLVDADDTLWENNVYFERVAGEFIARLTDRGAREEAVQEMLCATEQRNVHVTGYGSAAFCASLHEVARAFEAADLEPWIQEQEQWICHHPIELMPGVAETLPLLFAINRLILVTKGQPREQTAKLERSGLAVFFHDIEIVFEKREQTYRDLVGRHGFDPVATWMIGNSPRSDINPAKAAGLNTVFIPYHSTWWHELEEISAEGGETLMLAHFGELARYFA